MDINDPRRRLQVMNASSPSLRVAAGPAPAPKVTVQSNAPAPRIAIPNATPATQKAPVYQPAKLPSFKPIADIGKAIVSDVARPVVATGMNWTQSFSNLGTRAAGGKAQTGEEMWGGNKLTRALANFASDGNPNALGTKRNVAGNAAQAALLIAPGAGKGLSTAGKIALDAGVGGGFNVANTYTNNPEADKAEYAKQGAIGAVVGGAARPLGAVLGKVFSPITNRFSANSADKVAKQVAKNKDANAIMASLNVDADTAKYLTGETDPAVIKGVLAELDNAPVGGTVDAPTAPVESPNQEADTGKVFYHGTGSEGLKSLADLQAGSEVGKSGRNRVYVTENPEIAKNFGDNVIEGRLYGKHLNVKDIGVERTPGWAQDNVVAPEFADYKTTKLLTEREKRVFENQFVKGVPNNTIIEDTPGIHKYLASKGYTTVTVPRTISDVDGVRSETIIIDKKAFQPPKPPTEDRFPQSGKKSFAPLTETTQANIDDLAKRASGVARPAGTTRVFQVTENGMPTDWVFDDADSLANFVNGRESSGMKLDFYDVPTESLKPTGKGENVFQVTGDINKISRTPTSEEIKAANKKTVESTAKEVQAAATEELKSGSMEQVAQAQAQQSGTSTPDVAPAAAQAAPKAIGTQVNKTADNAIEAVTDAKKAFPDADPETQKALQEVMDSLNEAQSSYDDVTKVRAKEKAQRSAAGGNAYEAAGGGVEGLRAKLGALKGKYSKSNFQPITIEKESQDAILNDIEASDLKGFQKLNVQTALSKVWGNIDEKPTTADVRNIRNYFNSKYGDGVGDDIADAVTELSTVEDGGVKSALVKIAGLPRALMATADLSGNRQAAPLGMANPKEWVKANIEAVKYTFKPNYYKSQMETLAKDPDLDTITEQMGVALPGLDDIVPDEAFIGSDWAEKIPFYGKFVVQPSQRAYQGLLTKLRFDVAKKNIDAAGGSEQYLKNMEAIYGDDAKKAARAFGEMINTLSGRGGEKGGLLDKHMETLSLTLFAPRLWAANIQRLNPAWYAKLYKRNPEAAIQAARAQGTFLAMTGSILALADITGVGEVGTDPRSADFGKIKVGNTRYDILGGQQQNIVLAWRQITGQKVNSTTGEIEGLGEDFGDKTRMDLAFDMFQNKANPLLGFAMRMLQTGPSEDGSWFMRADQFGEDINVFKEAGKLAVPLGVQGAYDSSSDTGSPIKGIAMNAPSFFGAGVQTYGSIATKDKGTDGKFTGKVTEDMVTDYNGNPLLDDKGKVIRVKFPEGATALEKQALLDDKRRSTMAANYKKKLSGEDQALLKLSDKQLKEYVKSGKITQDRYDQLKQYQEDADNIDSVDIPDGANSQLARDFYKTYNSKSKAAQAKWLASEPDATAKKITEILNGERASGLSEFKPSNELAKAYAEFEKDINSHPEYTNVDRQNKAKAFQTFAYKLNYSDNQRDIYSEGSSADLKTLIAEGQISKEDLDTAIKMDNELYASGLTSTLKFSKSFRRSLGYDVPDGLGGFTSGGGTSSASKKTGINNLVPSSGSVNRGGAVPTFSSKPRSSMSSIPKVSSGSSGKKVTIKL